MRSNNVMYTGNRTRLAQTISGILIGTSYFSSVAMAQEQEQAPQNVQQQIERVQVTAERRAVSENEMPVSIVALSGESLENRNINDMDSLQLQVPNLVFTDNGNTKYLNIRGVGISESAPNQTTGVAVHLDGAYVAREFVYGDAFFDLASIEVLRGPQGTYSGQNASGGAIFINSKKPMLGETEGFISAELGNFNLTKYSGGMSFPLSDTLAARVSGNFERRDSFYDNQGPVPGTPSGVINDQPGNLDRSMGRFQLLYSPSYALEFRLIHERSKNSSDGVATKNYPQMGSRQLPDEGVWKLNYDIDGYRTVDYQRTTANVDWQAQDSFKLLANFSYFDSTQNIQTDGDHGSYLTLPDREQTGRSFNIVDRYWTGELNLVSTNDGPFEWTTGISMIDYEQDNRLNLLRYNTEEYPGTSLDLENHTRLFMYLNNIRKNQAVFAEIGYQFTPDFEVKAGVRYNEDEVGFSPDSYIRPGKGSYNAQSGAPFPQQLFEYDAWTGRVLANWHVNEDSMFYATLSRGYKPGGTSPFGPEYDSEYVLNKEVGWKASLLDGSLDAAVTLFHMDYDDFQRTFAPPDEPQESITRNVDGSTIAGIEVQLSGMWQDFQWDTSFAYNDGEYGDLEYVLPAGAVDGVNPTEPQSVNLEGRPIDFLPERSASFGFSYLGLQLDSGMLIPSVRVSHQAEFYTSFYQLDYQLTPSKTLLDLSLAFEADAGWRLELYAKNATDKLYVSRSTGDTNGQGTYDLGAPRQIGLKLKYPF